MNDRKAAFEVNLSYYISKSIKLIAKITRPAEEKFWGEYGGYFQDPDGYLWEIAWNPQMLPEE